MRMRIIAVSLISVVIVALGVWLSINAIQQLNDAAALQRDGQRTMATVSQKWIVATESRTNSHRIRYTFAFNDNDLTFERAVPVALHRVVHPGSTFQVMFSPANPDLHEIFPGQIAGTARSKLTSGLIISGFGLLLFVIGGGGRMFRKPETDV